jgi:Domain of unknown function (DUF5664)
MKRAECCHKTVPIRCSDCPYEEIKSGPSSEVRFAFPMPCCGDPFHCINSAPCAHRIEARIAAKNTDVQASINAATHGSVGHLTTDRAARKERPIATGVLDYFPDALADVARLSKIGNDQHNPGEPMHWARGKSMDQADCIMRHMIDRGTIDTDGVLHDTKVAWRALAQLQLSIERLRASGVDY